MDIILSTLENENDIKSYIRTASINDNIVLYYKNLEEVISLLDDNLHKAKISIRGSFCQFNENIIKCFQQNNIFISLEIDESINLENLKYVADNLFNNNIEFELFILNSVLENDLLINSLTKIIYDNKINIRVSYRTGVLYSYMQKLRQFQDYLLLNGCEIILKPFSSSFKSSEIKVNCQFVNIDERIIADYSSYLSDCDIGKSKTCEISNSSIDFTLLPSITWNDNESYSYIRDLEMKKISSRILSKKSSNKNPAENGEYDIILIYADRLRNRLSAPYPPIGLYYLNSVVKEKGFTCKVIEITESDFVSIYNNQIMGHCKVVGFYCACNNEFLVTNMVKYIKRNSKEISVLIGGPQTFALGEDFLKNTQTDVIVEGEGEGAIVELLNYFIKGTGVLSDIKNIKYIDNDQIIKNAMRDVISDLDSIPYAKIKYSDISKHNTITRLFILTGRGCPNRCTFCYEGANSRKVRYRSMDNVFEEINYLLNEFPLASLIHVLDDTFTCNEKRVIDFCNRMKDIRKNRNVEWVCEVHINTVYNKPELLNLMIQSGLKGFQIGLESGSDEILKVYKKNTSIKMIKEFIDTCVGLNSQIFIEGNIIIGGPFESTETIAKSLELCKYLITKARGIVELQSLSFVPLPNTDITLHPEKYGLKLLWDEMKTSTLAMLDIVTETDFLTKDQLELAKAEFDNEIKKLYLLESLFLTPKQIMSFWDPQNHQFMTASKWGFALNHYDHFRNYALSKAHEDSITIVKDNNVIPIRTFESMKYLKETLEKETYHLSESDKLILNYCNGKWSVSEIANKLGLSTESLLNATDNLENKCLLRYSLV